MSPILDSIGSVKAFGWGSVVSVPNSFESIATVTVGPAGAANITFSTIPTTYKHLQLRMNLFNSVGTNCFVTFNGDTNNNYWQHGVESYGGGSTAVNGGGNLYGGFVGNLVLSDIYPGNSVLDIFDYQNTSYYKVIKGNYGTNMNSSGYSRNFYSDATWGSTSPITSINLSSQTSIWVEHSQVALYGIKG